MAQLFVAEVQLIVAKDGVEGIFDFDKGVEHAVFGIRVISGTETGAAPMERLEPLIRQPVERAPVQ